MLPMAFMASAQYSAAYVQSVNQSEISDILEGFVGSISGKRVSFDYSYTLSVSSGSRMTGSGHVVFQGDSFLQEGNGLETFCDGRSKWTVDRSAKEAVAESVDSSSPDYLSYPTFIIRDMDKVFRPDYVSGNGTGTAMGQNADGQDLVSVKLRPAVLMGKISSALLYFAKGTYRPVALDLYLDDGSVLKLSVSGYEVTPAIDDSIFSLEPGSLGEDYVITDLR